jgi:hypothetical protein
MARLLRGIATLCLLTLASAGPTAALTACSPRIDAVLTSPDCAPSTRLLSAAAAISPSDACASALRVLLEEAPTSLPCVTSVDSLREVPTGPNPHHLRRLSGYFSGKLKCKLDSPAPLTAADWEKGFMLECDSVNDYTWLYWILGICGGLVALWGLKVIVDLCKEKIRETRERRRREERFRESTVLSETRAQQRAIDEPLVDPTSSAQA